MALFALASFELSPAAEIYGEGKFVSIQSQSQGGPAFNCDVCGSGPAGPLTISLANPFLSTQARNALQSIGFTDSFTLNLDAEALGVNRDRTRRETARGVAGIREPRRSPGANRATQLVSGHVQDSPPHFAISPRILQFK